MTYENLAIHLELAPIGVGKTLGDLALTSDDAEGKGCESDQARERAHDVVRKDPNVTKSFVEVGVLPLTRPLPPPTANL
jgi:hypothetical protein